VNPNRIRRVIVRTPNWLGDSVMAVPGLRRLRRLFGDAHLALLCKASIAGLFEGQGLADEIIVVSGPSPGTFIKDAIKIRRAPWDLAVLLQNAIGAALFARAIGAKYIAGYPTDGRRLLLTAPVPLDTEHKTKHQVNYYLGIADYLNQMSGGVLEPSVSDVSPDLAATPRDRAAAQSLLSAHGLFTNDESTVLHSTTATVTVASKLSVRGVNPDEHDGPGVRPLVALNPGATNSRAKQWPPERFAQVADRLADQIGSHALIIGTDGDRPVAERVASLMKSPSTVLAGQTSISQLKGVLSYADILVSNDTGAAHLSAALGVPTVVVFGPTEHFSTRPLSDRTAVIRRSVDCSPCMLRDCPIDHRCMTGVGIDDVYEAARRLIV